MAGFSTAAIDELQSQLRGEVLGPSSPGYDEARTIWNDMIDRKPAAIARCVGPADVAATVRAAAGAGVGLAVRGGGHNVAGNAICDGGLVADLSQMRSARVDAAARTVRVDGGALLGDLDAVTQMHGLAVSAGIVSHTGVGGLALGGGFGWISRRHGLSVDNLLSCDVVTADGSFVRASADENSDLFWGLRGGGGNFGAVTSFEFRCAEIGTEVFAGIIARPIESAGEYFAAHREYVRTLPDEMTVWMVVRHAPPLPFLPPEHHGKLVVLTPFVFLGDEAEGRRLIEPLRSAVPTIGEHIGFMPWRGWQTGFDALNSHGARNYWKSHHLQDLADPCVEQIIEHARTLPTEQCEIFIPHMEGAPSRVPESETAYAHRSAPFVMNVHTRWEKPADDERCINWARGFFEATKPFAQGVYVNFLSDEGGQRVRDAYPKATWDRLVELKRKYDPNNLFRYNQNIDPAG